MIDREKLLTDLQSLLKRLETDLLDRSDSDEVPEVREWLREEYQKAKKAERTALTQKQWIDDFITQVAAAWVLTCVFVRFLEDNELVDPPKLAGPGNRLERARDEHTLFFQDPERAKLTDREYLLEIFRELARLPAAGDVFGEHNPLNELPNWLGPDAAGELLRFFQKIDPETGDLIHDFTDPEWDTRFLGDLYQDLSEAARKKYALLQTPDFVEEFILDRTLEPALDEFGLQSGKASTEESGQPSGTENRTLNTENFKMIDPACGSGHFLLGAFPRLLARWQQQEPGTNVRELVQRSLDSIHGVDINPFAIAIARFRLLLAALKACGITKLKDAPAFHINLACGDSLYHGRQKQMTLGDDWTDEAHYFKTEDVAELRRILKEGQYHAVVANPPYITPKDKAANNAYRELYSACHRQYSLSVPFMQRIFGLASRGDKQTPAGFTGQITANSFMKRVFGTKLIEEFLPRVDLTHIIDTSLAYVPGHGTPTLILYGRNNAPVSENLRAVLGIQRENEQPSIPSHGKVWQSILSFIDFPGKENEYVSSVEVDRANFNAHPWSLGGGGASELKESLDKSCETRLRDHVESIGFYQDTHADEAFVQPLGFSKRKNIQIGFKPQVRGDNIRNWIVTSDEEILFPYDDDFTQWEAIPREPEWAWLYALRTSLWSRSTFGGGTYRDVGRPWFDYHQFPKDRAKSPFAIVFAFVATHNHFIFNHEMRVFNRSAPVIKLPNECDPTTYAKVTGLLNSSISAFWLRQACHDKGGGGIGGGIAAEAWERFLEYTGTAMKDYPLPQSMPLNYSESLNRLAEVYASTEPMFVATKWKKTDGQHSLEEELTLARSTSITIRTRMIRLQEDLDWECYKLYGLIDEDLTYDTGQELGIELGQHAFEIVMARKMAAGKLQTTWFDRHGSTPITELPEDWPEDYKQLVNRRIELIETEKNIGLIEQPEYKRRWNTEPWESQVERALQTWLLDRLESYFDFDGRMNDEGTPTAKVDIQLISVAQLADIAASDDQFLEVGSVYRDDPAFNVQKLVEELVKGEHVPLLPVLRYKPSGLRKRQQWEETWELQRKEDAGEDVGDIPVPPKYKSSDFISTGGARYWALRGKLDVPKERWISFPHCEGEDGSLMLCWAGYDHLQQAQAISAHFVNVQEHLGGRDDPRLHPLLACLIELLPWLKQWHNEVDPEFGMAMGDYFQGFITEEARNLGMTVEDLKAWEPEGKSGRRSKSKSSS